MLFSALSESLGSMQVGQAVIYTFFFVSEHFFHCNGLIITPSFQFSIKVDLCTVPVLLYFMLFTYLYYLFIIFYSFCPFIHAQSHSFFLYIHFFLSDSLMPPIRLKTVPKFLATRIINPEITKKTFA